MTTTFNDFNIKPGMSLWAEMPTGYQAEYATFLSDVAADALAVEAVEVSQTDELWAARVYEKQAVALLT